MSQDIAKLPVRSKKAPALRAPIRLANMFGITLKMSAAYAFRRVFGEKSAAFSSATMQRWSHRILEALGIKVRVQGIECPQGCILIANHRSYVDIPVIMASVPCTFLAKSSVKKWPVIGWAASLVNTIFVEREDRNSRKAAREELKRRLDEGMSVMVFAEGTTAPHQELYDLRPGMFYLAAEHDLPIVPVAIEYIEAEDAWIGDDTFFGHFLRRFQQKKMRVAITYGPMLQGKDPESLRQNTQEWISKELGKCVKQRFRQGKKLLS